ncbi:MAG: class I SAM-dependent methyltransferase [Actinomycetota bacterium]|nr:class I SAM-dependent methyltransferase [Actinomycetota bacterium]
MGSEAAKPAVLNVYTGSSDRWHDDYERGRPGWPLEVVAIPALPSAATVLELGAGTGKLTRLLVAKFENVIAVEPDEGMRRLLVALCPGARVLAGSAEEIPFEDGSVDAVFAAEAFHWFDGFRGLAEIARVLRPRGTLVVMWTRYASGEWRHAVAESPFEELQEARLPNPQVLDRDGLVAYFASMGWIADLPEVNRLPLLDEVRSLLAAPEYRRRWEAHVYWTRLVAAPQDAPG